jgi:V/A-type H+-transporting ATPase subunit D
MARYNVVPTKSNLMRLKRELGFTREGYELLEQKRQILVVELMGLIDKTTDAQEKVEKELARAYQALENAVVTMGRTRVEALVPAVNIHTDLNITMRKLMGVNIPSVEVTLKETAPYFSTADTRFWADETIMRFKNLLTGLGDLARLRISLMRIAQEAQKTMRRVNALDKIAIPEYQESIKYIEDSLEESERETFALLKLVKQNLDKKKE